MHESISHRLNCHVMGAHLPRAAWAGHAPGTPACPRLESAGSAWRPVHGFEVTLGCRLPVRAHLLLPRRSAVAPQPVAAVLRGAARLAAAPPGTCTGGCTPAQSVLTSRRQVAVSEDGHLLACTHCSHGDCKGERRKQASTQGAHTLRSCIAMLCRLRSALDSRVTLPCSMDRNDHSNRTDACNQKQDAHQQKSMNRIIPGGWLLTWSLIWE